VSINGVLGVSSSQLVSDIIFTAGSTGILSIQNIGTTTLSIFSNPPSTAARLTIERLE
jgi:hypothetical protein